MVQIKFDKLIELSYAKNKLGATMAPASELENIKNKWTYLKTPTKSLNTQP